MPPIAPVVRGMNRGLEEAYACVEPGAPWGNDRHGRAPASMLPPCGKITTSNRWAASCSDHPSVDADPWLFQAVQRGSRCWHRARPAQCQRALPAVIGAVTQGYTLPSD